MNNTRVNGDHTPVRFWRDSRTLRIFSVARNCPGVTPASRLKWRVS
jgi:hypothetical protein